MHTCIRGKKLIFGTNRNSYCYSYFVTNALPSLVDESPTKDQNQRFFLLIY